MNPLRFLLALTIAATLTSCATNSPDYYYQQTAAAQVDPSRVQENDIVGDWFDTYARAGNKHELRMVLYPNHTGTYLIRVTWLNGGGMRASGDVQWAYDAQGGWNIRRYNTRMISGEGRVQPTWEFHVRKLNGRLYEDKRQCTWVPTKNTALVLEKSQAADQAINGGKQRSQNLQELSGALNNLSGALSQLR